jgi:fimbrial chaperone protein
MRRHSRLFFIASLAFAWSSWTSPALAGTLRVNPVLLELDAQRRSASLTITNEENVPVTIRAQALSWRQESGDNVQEQSSDLIVSPPVSTIAPRATQVVRIGQRRPSRSPKAYRLIVEEVPEASPRGGIQVALRLDLPLFIDIAPSDAEGLVWSAQRRPDGSLAVQARNPGTGYVRVDHELATAATGLDFADHIFFGTILPGSFRRWSIAPEATVIDRDRLQSILQANEIAPATAVTDRP